MEMVYDSNTGTLQVTGVDRLAYIDTEAQNAVTAYEKGKAALYRNDKPIHGPEIHEEKMAALKAELNGAFEAITGKLKAMQQQARNEALSIEHADPSRLLSADELATVNNRRSFVEQDLRTLPTSQPLRGGQRQPSALEGRLQAVIIGTDKAERWLYWQTAKVIITEMRERTRNMNHVPSDMAARLQALSKAERELSQLLNPDQAERAKASMQRFEDIGKKLYALNRKLAEADGRAAAWAKEYRENFRRSF